MKRPQRSWQWPSLGWFLASAFAVGVSGCGTGLTSDPVAPGTDASASPTSSDGGAAGRDAGAPVDAGAAPVPSDGGSAGKDAGLAGDAGSAVDAGLPMDAGRSGDAGFSGGTIAIDGSAPKAAATRYGQNYWCWDGYGNNMPVVQPLVPALHLDLLRAGGYNNDADKSSGAYGTDPFGQSQIDTFVTYARAVGAEPIIQVPLIENYMQHGGTTANPADAAAMVTYANITNHYGVKYWEIGNEPDLYSSADLPGYTVDRFIADFKAFSAAMKAVDPSIKLLGPELSWKYYPTQPKNSANDWLTPFIVQAKGAYDIIAIHRYPFAAADCTLSAAMGDVGTFVAFAKAIQDLIAGNAPGTPFAITEANITWDGNPTIASTPLHPRQSTPASGWPTFSAPRGSRGSGPSTSGASRRAGRSGSSMRRPAIRSPALSTTLSSWSRTTWGRRS